MADAAIQNQDDGDRVLVDGVWQWGAKTLTDGPGFGTGPGGVLVGRQNFTDWGPVHGKGPAVSAADETTHDRMYGNIGFADAHVAVFADTGVRDGAWGASLAEDRGGYRMPVYDELEGKVYGGWLTRNGLNW